MEFPSTEKGKALDREQWLGGGGQRRLVVWFLKCWFSVY